MRRSRAAVIKACADSVTSSDYVASVSPVPPVGVGMSTGPLDAILEQLHDVVAGLSAAAYVTVPAGVTPGTVGQHVRHCLDHVDALLAALHCGTIDYDNRERGTAIETDRQAALDKLAALRAALRERGAIDAGKPLRARILLAAEGSTIEVDTTAGREVAFVVSHTIHHNALIAAMVRALGGEVPSRFGYAPSTLAYQDRQRCAR